VGWFKVDDQLAFHAKIVAAGNSAMGLWIRAGSWSSAQLTDGFIPVHMANAMANGMASDADALVTAGLWDEVDGGFRFHDWSHFQPSAEEEREKRRLRSLAGKKGAAARWDGKPDGKSHSKSDADSMANECDSDAPTRPDQTTKKSVPRSGPKKPIPANWSPNEAHTQYAVTEGIALDFQAERFRTHAEANDRRIVNWDAAFKNWLLKAERTTKTKPTASSPWNKDFYK